ncbi:CDP-glycerol glycerophosphotransferase, TagB/SpsB family [Proteiniborus ethanoligenes]|uniref:CDP-glycerol glycerophosphotransferase, TagB/SpsB family n=1 Tax=Proteiniborus ethanoligenes TaxID=415015 RepID=A0A1H3QVY5_9FIRM|nr:CDP-glycerol glycerophosphotransferase family protein [Proteiniborus ethanoligenes]SDZ17536.1 CDP-glycerol glycerophosphotransferase, TagB/SpsB family [Proteiniborus ethanoligenes]
MDIKLIEEANKDKVKDYGVHVTTHYNINQEIGKINIDLWHGFPIKNIGVLNKIENNVIGENYNNLSSKINFSASYSNLYTFLMSSCSKISADKFKITGAPRNDLLINKNSKYVLENLIKKDLGNNTIIFYVPTFRRRSFNKRVIEEGYSLEEVDREIKELNKFFEEKNIVLIVKKHAFTADTWRIANNDNVCFITNEMLNKYGIDFYEILGASDMLITDFSSIYFDYLLLDRPIIFFARDYDEYINDRGILLEPYEFWTPGPKTHNSEELKKEIEIFLKCKEYYLKEREQIKNIVHKFKDFNSSERVWKEIYEYIKSVE